MLRQDKKLRLVVLVSGWLGWGFGIAECRGADWPNWRGPDYNGISRETGLHLTWPEGGPKQLWQAAVGVGVSSMVVSEDCVYTMGNIQDEDVVFCLREATGEPVWKYAYPSPVDVREYEGGPNATPLVHGEHLYTIGREGDLYCFKKTTGEILWHHNLKAEYQIKTAHYGFTGSPQIIGGLLVLNAGTSGMAFQLDSGEPVWKTGQEPTSYTSPVPYKLGDTTCVAIVDESSVAALRADSGQELWRVPWKTPLKVSSADPIIVDQKLFVSSGYGKGCALYDISGDQAVELWRNRNMRNQYSTCIIWEGHIYGFDGNIGGSGDSWTAGKYSFRCLDFQTGQLKWSQSTTTLGALTMAEGKLILLTVDGILVIVAAAPEKYEELARCKVLTERCWTVPVLANGKLLVRNAQGQLICLDVR